MHPNHSDSLPSRLVECFEVLEAIQGEGILSEDRLRRCRALDAIMQYALTATRKNCLELTNLLGGYSQLLLSYAHTGAVQAIREGNAHWIQNGLIALALENLSSDWRDTLVILSLLGHSARKLSAPLDSMVENATRVATKECSDLIRGFYERPIEEQSIELMGYREGKRKHGFSYLETD